MAVNVRNLLLILLLGVISCATQRSAPIRLPAQVGSCQREAERIIEGFQSRVTLEKAYKRTRPGQLSYGRPRVDYLRSRLEEWDFDEIQEYFDGRPIPYVENPAGDWVIHDRHHFLLAIFKEKEELLERFPEQRLELTYHRTTSFKGKSWSAYRQYMEEKNYVHLRFKGEAATWDDLPQTLESLKKDYFRGMAWVLIKAGIVEKNPVPFFEFQWAEFLRKRFVDLPTKWRLKNVRKVMEDILSNPSAYRELPGLDHELPDIDEALDAIDSIASELNW